MKISIKVQLARKIASFFICVFLSFQAYHILEHYLLGHVKIARKLDIQESPSLRESKMADEDIESHIEQSARQLSCFEKNFFNGPELEKCLSSQLESTAPAEYLSEPAQRPSKTGLISVMEWLLIFGLAIQMYLTIYTLFMEKNLIFDGYVFHISDWAINTPPIIGVLANLLSFALMLSMGGSSVEALFSSNYFFEAIITTVIGGLFYIANLAMKIIIHPRIE